MTVWRSLLLTLAACGAAQAPRATAPADLVLEGGDVRTMDPAHPHASAVAVRGETIVAVGDDLRAWIGPRTRVVDLHGATVTPGLVDAHCHLYELGANLEAIDVRSAASEDEAADLVRKAAQNRSSAWLVGRGWDQNRWPGQRFPHHFSLDIAMTVDVRPVLLERVDGHAIWVNTAALQAAGITAQTPDPPGGRIVRNEQGEPTGVLIDNATDLVWAKLPPTSDATRQGRILEAAKVAVSNGLTGIHEMGIERETALAYETLVDRNELPLRVYAFERGDPAHPDALGKPWPAHGRFEMRGVKFFADGALGSRGARLYEPYDDDPKNSGLWVTEPAQLSRAVSSAVRKGWQVAIHAIGDAGIGSVLDAYQAAEANHPGDLRLRIEHLQVLAEKDLPRVIATHAIASMQPTHATSDMAWAEARIGKQRILGAYAWRTMLDHHVPLAFGSDFPVEEVNPLLGIYAAVTREDKAGNPAGGWYPAQRMTLDEAIAAFTRGAAYAQFAETHRGTIGPGMDADLTVFDRALAPDRSLLKTRVQMTVVAGQIVYQSADKR